MRVWEGWKSEENRWIHEKRGNEEEEEVTSREGKRGE